MHFIETKQRKRKMITAKEPKMTRHILSKKVICESKDGDSTTYLVRVKCKRGQSPDAVAESFYYNCHCSHDCCGHMNVTPWFYTLKNVKRNEWTFEISATCNV